MQISIISSSVYPASPYNYGSEVQNSYLASGLARKGHEVHFFAPPQSTHYEPAMHILIPGGNGLVDYRAEGFPYRRFRETLANSDFVIDWSATCKAAGDFYFWEGHSRNRPNRNPVVVYCRNGADLSHPFPPANRNIPGVVLSEAIREISLATFDNLNVIPYGVPTVDVYTPAKNPTLDYFLYLGAPRKEKGIYTILKLAEMFPGERFVFAWRANNEEHRKEEANFLGEIRDYPNVEFMELPEGEEHLERKVELYQNAKALIKPDLPDYIEAFGLVSAESLACGTPVVASSHGANPEVVEYGVTGYLGDSVEKLRYGLENIDNIDRSDCRMQAIQHFSVDRMVDNYLKLYQKLVRRKIYIS